MKKISVKELECKVQVKREHVLLAAIAFAIIVFPWAAKPYIDTFSTGTSFARVYGFAVYLLILAGASFIAPLLKRQVPEGIWKAQVAIIGFLFLYGFAGQVYLGWAMGSAPNEVLLAFDSNGYSSTSYGHNHILKAIFCPFNPDQEDVDCARPTAAYLPWGCVGLAMAAWLLGGMVSVLAYLRLDRMGDKAAYAILSFASLRTCVDGGLLSFDFAMFCMLVAFHLAKGSRMKASIVGLPVGVAIITAVSLAMGYALQVPMNIFPMLLILYSLWLFFDSPRSFFPLLAIALLAPLLQGEIPVVQDRWSPEICQNAEVDPTVNETARGILYTPCEADIRIWCGRITAANGSFTYEGYNVTKMRLVVAKSLSEKCGQGVFSIHAKDPKDVEAAQLD